MLVDDVVDHFVQVVDGRVADFAFQIDNVNLNTDPFAFAFLHGGAFDIANGMLGERVLV